MDNENMKENLCMPVNDNNKGEASSKKIETKECPKITLIAAVSKNGVIGVKGEIPWRLKTDMQHFKEYTMGKVLVMGANTFESLPVPLKDRITIVLTRNEERIHKVINGWKERGLQIPVVIACNSLSDLVDSFELIKEEYTNYKLDELVVCGGDRVYKEFVDFADRIVLTFVYKNVSSGDAFFPPIDLNRKDQWKKIRENSFFENKDNECKFKIYIYERPKQAHVITLDKKLVTKFDRLKEYDTRRN